MSHEPDAIARREFIQLVSDQFVMNNIADHIADQYADQAMRDFEEMERTSVGDPDYVWGCEGAEIMAAEYIECYLGEN